MNDKREPITSVGDKLFCFFGVVFTLGFLTGFLWLVSGKVIAGALTSVACLVSFIVAIVVLVKKKSKMRLGQASKRSEEQAARDNTHVSDESVNKHRKFDDLIEKFNGDITEAIKYTLLNGTKEDNDYYVLNEFTQKEKSIAYHILAELPKISSCNDKPGKKNAYSTINSKDILSDNKDNFTKQPRKIDVYIEKYEGDLEEALKNVFLSCKSEEIEYIAEEELTNQEARVATKVLSQLYKEHKIRNPYILPVIMSILKIIIINGLLILFAAVASEHHWLSDKWIDIIAYSIPAAFCSTVALDFSPKIVDCFRFWKMIRKGKSLINDKSK